MLRQRHPAGVGGACEDTDGQRMSGKRSYHQTDASQASLVTPLEWPANGAELHLLQ